MTNTNTINAAFYRGSKSFVVETKPAAAPAKEEVAVRMAMSKKSEPTSDC